MSIQMMCSKCKGSGEIIRNPCVTCKGVGIATINSREKVNVPKGINSGQNLRIPGKGNESESSGPAGDLIMKVNVKKDPYYEREGYDIYTKAYITVAQVIF